MKPAYYNEFDKQTAAWLRELISQGHIAPGDVDERSIEDVNPDDLRGYTQCHFFAGIGVWSYALRRAGWPDDRPIWTGSCPCQPFSAAGKGVAFDDERHLWPAFHHLIKVGKPATILGEQVASKAVDPWIDLVHADLEALGYAFGSVPFPSAGIGAPHIRDRNYWMANAASSRLAERGESSGSTLQGKRAKRSKEHPRSSANGIVSGRPKGLGSGLVQLADTDQHGRTAHAGPELHDAEHNPESCGGSGGLSDAGNGSGQRSEPRPAIGGLPESAEENAAIRSGPTNGYWSDADWLGCRDGKWRPVEPGTFPLVTGAAARVVRLRGYGNAINAEQAKIWIETVMECIYEKN